MKLRYSITYKILALIMLLSFALSLPVLAEDTKDTFQVFLVDNENQEHRFRENVDIIVWKLSAKDEATATGLKESLDKTKVADLPKSLGQPMLEATSNQDGLVDLGKLDEDGFYYIRQKDEKLDKVLIPTLIKGSSESKAVYIKSTIPKPERGRRRFKKIDGKTNQALEGAKFKVTILNEKNEYESVLKDNLQYTLISDSKGMMEAIDLDYGKYFLWEVEAPKGYEKLTSPIPFEVNETSEFEAIIGIKNMPHNPPKIKIPQTGDVILYMMCLGGLLLIGIGYKIVRE